jgi:gliding motility-associated-like protein
VVSNSFSCSDSAFINVTVFDKAIANAGPDETIILGGAAILSGSISGLYDSFYWANSSDIDNLLALQPLARPIADAKYILSAVSKNNCGISSDTVFVKLYRGIFIPSAFTPNNDHENDTWNIPALDAYPDFELLVYNRYGQIVFRNTKLRKPWDGSFKLEPLPSGAYPYILKLNTTQALKGTVLIIH